MQTYKSRKELFIVVYTSENQIKNELGINNWRNLLNDKMIRFTSMMPRMEATVMTGLVGQLPQFWLFSKDTLKIIETRSPISQDSPQVRHLPELKRLLDRDFDTEHNKPELKQLYFGIISEMTEPYFAEGALTESDRKYVFSLRDLQDCGTRTMLISVLSYIGGRFQEQLVGQSASVPG